MGSYLVTAGIFLFFLQQFALPCMADQNVAADFYDDDDDGQYLYGNDYATFMKIIKVKQVCQIKDKTIPFSLNFGLVFSVGDMERNFIAVLPILEILMMVIICSHLK